MIFLFGLVIVPEESVVQPKLQDDGDERQRYGEERQDSELIRFQVPRVDRHQKEPDRPVGYAANSEDQRVLDRLLYLFVDRKPLPRICRRSSTISQKHKNKN